MVLLSALGSGFSLAFMSLSPAVLAADNPFFKPTTNLSKPLQKVTPPRSAKSSTRILRGTDADGKPAPERKSSTLFPAPRSATMSGGASEATNHSQVGAVMSARDKTHVLRLGCIVPRLAFARLSRVALGRQASAPLGPGEGLREYPCKTVPSSQKTNPSKPSSLLAGLEPASQPRLRSLVAAYPE